MTIAEQVTQLKTDFDQVKQAGYDAGYAAGQSAGGNTEEAYNRGRNDEWDAFWDGFQCNGDFRITSYLYYNFNMDVFKPKYDLVVSSTNKIISYAFAYTMSYSALKEDGWRGRFDFAKILKDQGKTLDISTATDVSYLFWYSDATHLPSLNLSKATNVRSMFAASAVEIIDEIVFSTTTAVSSMFTSATALVTISKVSGTIGKTGMSLKQSTKLSKESIQNIIGALSKTTSGLTITFSMTAVKNAFGQDAEETGSAWDLYKQENCPNWTVALE